MAKQGTKSDEKVAQTGFQDLVVGALALVLQGSGKANRVRTEPKIGARIKGGIPEHAVVAILPKPKDWSKGYPYNDGVHIWWYVRGRTKAQLSDGRFRVIEGWTAASKNGELYLGVWDTEQGCLDTMGTALDTHLQQGQQAYVLPAEGLNVRKEADPHGDRIGGLRMGTVVTVGDKPACDSKMVWWKVKPLNAARLSGWVSEGAWDIERDFFEWYLAPLTLE
ncbi:MAG: SH3 domain-containing protein [Anaerolineae bacterium]|nr:SH3 domain-containing protein [Anaerolineae bacterium]